MLLTPLLLNTVSIEKITGLNPPYDHFNDELHVDVAEFYDYHQTEIPVSNNPFSIFRPEYKFNILPTALNSSIKIEVILTNGDSKILILFIAMK